MSGESVRHAPSSAGTKKKKKGPISIRNSAPATTTTSHGERHIRAFTVLFFFLTLSHILLCFFLPPKKYNNCISYIEKCLSFFMFTGWENPFGLCPSSSQVCCAVLFLYFFFRSSSILAALRSIRKWVELIGGQHQKKVSSRVRLPLSSSSNWESRSWLIVQLLQLVLVCIFLFFFSHTRNDDTRRTEDVRNCLNSTKKVIVIPVHTVVRVPPSPIQKDITTTRIYRHRMYSIR